MKVTNNGEGLKLELDYTEASILTEALRKGAQKYENENSPEFAKQVNVLLDELMNKQIVETPKSKKVWDDERW